VFNTLIRGVEDLGHEFANDSTDTSAEGGSEVTRAFQRRLDASKRRTASYGTPHPVYAVTATGHPRLRSPSDAPMSCQGPSGSGSARRSVICSVRCSALVRDRPMVVMTLRWPRRSRMSQVRPGGCARVLVEPVSISTLTAGMAAFWDSADGARAGVAGMRTRQGRAAPGWRASSY